ncbi:putative E3 ubiquitin-protein ligase listerin [Clavispora lusitaniae]|uniref:E3 ubiquitin-protein ligase listerin n=1 Tax=Clavispora lusitaniae TaxID=36911 RepID=A0ACD0WMI5_CLALS|nr:putative E3 ubiquitin-protein ligase listerin [Clavispora lusitaniae]QFZ34407.1 putative E3 ubiquitin-protein ligase listerin [Clavispora lusitaniae]QFZ40091.1 putative E3 ubiquitin-protein ligase listerin [Clavispora lusitaniae]QFZ45773.1 putative E3 ubiquitin-protein ligase listerin [Clavispora lusitaniae]QFZ51437.1 putative E3 ubiquitin-protein ligase listerin [Clavispora lusitaniae]
MSEKFSAHSREPGDLGYNGFVVSLFYLAPVEVEQIRDPHVVITLKGLTKKNAVTKEKRLAEFLRMLSEGQMDVHDTFILMCWLQLYPRMAIDSSKAVRQLAHQIQATYMDRIGGKEFSKYLKSSIASWLQSLYDEKAVSTSSYRSLLESFGNDKERVNTKIWMVFHEQIINYCHAVLAHETASTITDERYETADDVLLKYYRAQNGAIQMLLKIISLANDNSGFVISESAMTQVNEILTHEPFWDHLGLCCAGDSINVNVFRGYLSLLKILFASDDKGFPMPFTSHMDNVRSVYRLISKKFIKHVKLQTGNASNVIYSSVLIDFWNTLTTLTSVTSWNDDVRKKHKLKKNFWVLGGSKSYSRLKSYIKLGPCQSDPVFYVFLKNFFCALAQAGIESEEDFLFLNFTSSKDAKTIIESSLGAQFQEIGRINGFAYKDSCSQCLYQVLDLFQLPDSQSRKFAAYIFDLVLDGLSVPSRRVNEKEIKQRSIHNLATYADHHGIDLISFNSALTNHLGRKEPFRTDEYQFTQSFESLCETYISLLLELSSNDSFVDLQTKLLESLSELFEVEEVSMGFKLLTCFLRTSSEINGGVEEWAATLASYITDTFVDQPLSVLELLLKKKIRLNEKEVFGDFFSKIAEVSPPDLAKLLVIAKKFDVNVKEVPDLWNYLVKLSEKTSRSSQENEAVFSYLGTPEIFGNVIGSSNTESFKLDLIQNISHLRLPVLVHEDLQLPIKALVSVALGHISSDASREFLALVEDKDLIKDSVFQRITKKSYADDFRDIADYVAQNPHIMPLDAFQKEITMALNAIDLYSIAISNPLGQTAHIVETCTEQNTFLSEHVLSIGKFLFDYLSIESQEVSVNLVTLIGLCAEYTQDYNFIVDVDRSSITLLDLKKDLLTYFLEYCSVDNVVLAQFFNASVSDRSSLIFEMESSVSGKGPFNALQFYHARIVAALFEPIFENMPSSTFETLDIHFSKLTGHPLKLAILLCTAKKFSDETNKLDRVQGYVFGEILGIRNSTQILKEGPKWLSLASEFLKLGTTSKSLIEVLPKHKLGMLISSLATWLECDIAYDDEFIGIRSLMANFLTLLLPLTVTELPEKAWEVAVNLCLNNFATVQVQAKELELKYFTMKLLNVLSSLPTLDHYPSWTESRISVIEELVELMINEEVEGYCSKCHNQPVALSNEMVERILKKENVPNKIIGDNLDRFFDLVIHSRFLTMQRLATFLLGKYIRDSQEVFVVEHELKISSLHDQDTDNLKATLPTVLVDAISASPHFLADALDAGELHSAAKFLWSWLLIFTYFKDTTYSIKNDYISQLKEKDVIRTLLDSIFSVVDVSDGTFTKSLVIGALDKNEKVDPEKCTIQSYDVLDGCIGEPVSYEMRFLLVHLYYLSFQYFGTQVSQWYNEIRDLQLKQQVERFSVRFVSPILIDKMLVDIDRVKAKLTSKDENLSIKISKVSNEIKSVYVIDEQTMEMVVKIPDSFPLANITVEGPMRLGVKENQWKAWLLASQRVVSLMNGSIIDCIELFNKNVNLHFSGFEECAICYSILHQDHSLPSKVCPTCSNKFHSACLYKWFKSSGSSTCPLCRSAFNFKASRA